MIAALNEIITFIGSLIDLVVKIVTGLVQLLQMIPSMVQTLTGSLGLLPPILVAFASVTITVAVIFIILGREGGGQS